MLTDTTTSTIEQVELEIEIAASPEKVWKALMEDTTFWWPKNFYTGPKAKGFHIEPRLGGRAYEARIESVAFRGLSRMHGGSIRTRAHVASPGIS